MCAYKHLWHDYYNPASNLSNSLERQIKAPTKIKIQKRNKNLLNLTEKLLVPLCEHELAQITPEKWLPTTGKKEE